MLRNLLLYGTTIILSVLFVLACLAESPKKEATFFLPRRYTVLCFAANVVVARYPNAKTTTAYGSTIITTESDETIRTLLPCIPERK